MKPWVSCCLNSDAEAARPNSKYEHIEVRNSEQQHRTAKANRSRVAPSALGTRRVPDFSPEGFHSGYRSSVVDERGGFAPGPRYLPLWANGMAECGRKSKEQISGIKDEEVIPDAQPGRAAALAAEGGAACRDSAILIFAVCPLIFRLSHAGGFETRPCGLSGLVARGGSAALLSCCRPKAENVGGVRRASAPRGMTKGTMSGLESLAGATAVCRPHAMRDWAWRILLSVLQ